MMTETLPKSYTPAEHESAVSAKWDEARAFHAEPSATTQDGRPPYCILIPPPNVTAALHLGHALNNTLQDVLVRYHHMRGFNTLWMPGTDHAGIATQTVVDKRLQSEGKPSLKDYKKMEAAGQGGREQFIAKVQEWKDEYEATITEQLKAMGCSCDFERQRFTMDDMCAKAVREAFFMLFKEGLIYRGKRLVNWDPVSLTALADDEVEMEEVDGHFWYLRYPLVHASENPDDPFDCREVTWSELAARGYPGAEEHPEDEVAWVTVATTRPETYLGDTAVAVNPGDPRAASLRSLWVQLPLVGRVIPIIEDSYVVMPDPESSDPKAKMATGFLKVTPAHDPNDYEIGQRHAETIQKNTSGEVMVNVMAPDASISDQHGWSPDDVGDARLFIGLSREEARDKVVAEFKARGLLEAVKPHRHSVGHSYRSHVPVEPYLSDQWYVKVTDDRLVGEAQRAMAVDQFEGEKPPPTSRDRGGAERPETSRDREGAVSASESKAATSPPGGRGEPSAFLITFTCYGTWLHGDERGSVDDAHNIPGTPTLLGDERRERAEFERLAQPPLYLDAPERRVVQEAIVEVCRHRGWRLIALHVRRTHLHAVVAADVTPERVMNDFKAYATRRLRERGLVDEDRRVWTRHGSTRYLNGETSFRRAIEYVVDEQGDVLDPAPMGGRAQPLPYGRGSSGGDSSGVAGDGALQFFPARYAKTYQSWHDNLRDWCISRQLWWGHRIPVWSWPALRALTLTQDDRKTLERWESEGRIALRFQEAPPLGNVDVSEPGFHIAIPSHDNEVVQHIEEKGFTQDPDVLDTWFSSGLWPLSTMGWPEPEAYPDTEGLLDVFNPTSVLCTAREIITLWVSRMVMFNRFFTGDHRVPFRDVYIHPMIQDGHGQKMSKSLGNGVDPRDIIHTHGADAMRFVLCGIATATQDVRMPVDTMCPHCGEAFHPSEITTPAGHRVAAPEQTCPACGKGMVSVYGYATGAAKPTGDKPLARNTSSKFDLGRNFCNKLWNATRFALSNLERHEGTEARRDESVEHDLALDGLSLPDRWILTRLSRTLRKVNDAVASYQFNVFADAMYDFVWREFCDWYLEAIKPTVRDDPAQQQVLRTVLNAILRMLHPISPFVTETLWPHVQETLVGQVSDPSSLVGRVSDPSGGSESRPTRLQPLPGVILDDAGLLATACWPEVDPSIEDDDAATTFERLRGLVESIRTIRGEHQVPPKRRITLRATERVRSLVKRTGDVIPTLAGLETIKPLAAKESEDVPFSFEGEEQALANLAERVDLETQRKRLEEEIAGLEKRIQGHEGRLANRGYVEKAPEHLVQQTRDELEQFKKDLALKRETLNGLSGE